MNSRHLTSRRRRNFGLSSRQLYDRACILPSGLANRSRRAEPAHHSNVTPARKLIVFDHISILGMHMRTRSQGCPFALQQAFATSAPASRADLPRSGHCFRALYPTLTLKRCPGRNVPPRLLPARNTRPGICLRRSQRDTSSHLVRWMSLVLSTQPSTCGATKFFET